MHPIVDYDGKQIPLASDTVDVVFSSNVLEQVPDVEGPLGEMKRVLVPGGLAIHVLPTPAWRYWTTLTHYPWVAKRIVQRAFSRAAANGAEGGVVRAPLHAWKGDLHAARPPVLALAQVDAGLHTEALATLAERGKWPRGFQINPDVLLAVDAPCWRTGRLKRRWTVF